MSRRRVDIDGVWYSVEWTCAYRGKVDYVVHQFSSSARADVELSHSGEWAPVFGNIPESIVRRAIIAYERAERAEFVAWALRQDYHVDIDAYAPHPILLSA